MELKNVSAIQDSEDLGPRKVCFFLRGCLYQRFHRKSNDSSMLTHLPYSIEGGVVRVGHAPQVRVTSGLWEHAAMHGFLRQLVAGGVVRTRHEVNRHTALHGDYR